MRIFKKHINQHSIVCCSGGVDSICAAHYLQKKFNVHELYHFNHGTPQANAFQQAVEKFAHDFKFNLTIRHANHSLTSEAEFRDARFEYIRSQTDKTFITGHNLDEASESYLLNCFNGVVEYIPIPVISEFGSNKVIHPFLMIDKEMFRKYGITNGLDQYIVEDLSNFDPSSGRRAWIRNALMPQLREKNIGIKKIVLKKYLKLYEKQ